MHIGGIHSYLVLAFFVLYVSLLSSIFSTAKINLLILSPPPYLHR